MTVFQDFHDVLKYVRLPLLNPYFLHDCVENQPVITETRACQVSYFVVQSVILTCITYTSHLFVVNFCGLKLLIHSISI